LWLTATSGPGFEVDGRGIRQWQVRERWDRETITGNGECSKDAELSMPDLSKRISGQLPDCRRSPKARVNFELGQANPLYFVDGAIFWKDAAVARIAWAYGVPEKPKALANLEESKTYGESFW
jgi:hypothetical protein